MNKIPSSKDINWAYNKSLKHDSNVIQLGGYRSNGSIITDKAIEYNKYLNIKFKKLVYPCPQKDGAILDIDFWDGSNSFVSICVADNKTNISVKDGARIHLIDSLDRSLDWREFNIHLDPNKISILVDQKSIEYLFKSPHKRCTISFGNNIVPTIDGSDYRPSIAIKEVLAETEHGSFPLIIDNLTNIASY